MRGILLVNKPKGCSSHHIVNLVRRATGIKKVGHTGTLDPLAQGLLPICIGRATKIADFIQKDSKEYLATLQFGVQTDSYDSTGNVINESEHIPKEEDIRNILDEFRGNILQEPPMYSALKYKGQKLYELARKGITVQRKKREITIYSIELLDYNLNGSCKLLVKCSSGTYIRSLCNDIGIRLNTYGIMTDLTRTEVGNYKLNSSYEVDYISSLKPSDIEKLLISVESALESYEKIIIPDFFYERLLNGVAFTFKDREAKVEEQLKRVYCQGEFIGLGLITRKDEKTILKITKFLN